MTVSVMNIYVNMVTCELMYTPHIPETAEILDIFNPSVMDQRYKHPIVIHRGIDGAGSASHIFVKIKISV